MAGDRTHGYGMVLELTEQVLNDLLPAEPFPPVSDHFEDHGQRVSFDYDLFFPPAGPAGLVQLDTSIPDGILISTPFSLDIPDLDFEPGPRNLQASCSGTISVRHPLTAYDDGTVRCVGFDFGLLPPEAVTVDVTQLTGAAGHEGTVERGLASLVQRHLQRNVGRLTVFRVPLEEGGGPLGITGVDVRVINEDCVALLFSTRVDPTGNRLAFTRSDIAAGDNTVLIVSARTLLMGLVGPALMSSFSISGTVDLNFGYDNGTLSLRRPADISHLVDEPAVDRVTLEALEMTIGANGLDGTATLDVRGFGYRANGSLVFRVEIVTGDDGAVRVDYRLEANHVHLIIMPYVWLLLLLGIGLLPTLAGIVAIVLPVLPWIITPVLEALFDRLSMTGTLPTSIRFNSIVLDDLNLGGRAVVPPSAPPPPPALWLEGAVTATDAKVSDVEVLRVTGPASISWTTVIASHEGVYTARSSRMVFPLRYEWMLDGHPIVGGGRTEIGGVAIQHQIDDRTCTLALAIGDSFDGVLQVRATAADGMVRLADERVRIEGTQVAVGWHNVQVIAGPLAALEVSLPGIADAPIDWPTPPAAAGQTVVSRRINRADEQRRALKAGTGYDFPIE